METQRHSTPAARPRPSEPRPGPLPDMSWGMWLLLLGSLLLTPGVWAADGAPDKPTDAGPGPRALESVPSLNEVGSGRLLIRRDGESAYQALPTVDTRVGMDITALTARVRVAQRFTNPGEDWINAVYVFPLPDTAAVDRLKLSIGDRIVEGEIQGRQQARKTYQAAKAVGRKAGLVEQQRPNLFTTRVANIGPGETVTVDIEYQQKVTYERGRFSLRFPLTVGIRYIPGQTVVEGFDAGGWSYNTDQVSDASAITPPVVEPGRGIDNPVQMDIRLRAGMPLTEVSSAYHPISTRQSPDGDYRLSLAEGSVPADRDFELAWVPERAREPRAALFTQGAEDDAELYSLLMLMPPEVDAAKRNVPPRDMVFVIDTSGSMSGTSMEQAKAALLMGLGRLKAQDRFQLIEFNTVTRAMSDVLIPPSARNLAWARRWVERLRADGGTEIGRALEKALDSDPSEVEAGRMRQVIFLTDGSVGNELALFRIIADRLGRQRLYTVGIGSAPNSHFMREAAATGRGTFTHIGDVGEVAKRMDELFGKLEYPVLSDIQLSWLDGSGEGLPTGGVRDLYLHEPLMVTLKHGGGRGQIQVSGRFAGQPWSTRLPVRGGAMGRGLDVLWARDRIAELERSRSRGVDAETIRKAVTELGLRHHLVTAHTSLVAVERERSRPEGVASRDAATPNLKPKGWAMRLPGGRLPQTATPAALHALIGVLALAFATLVLTGFGRRGVSA